MTYCGTTVTDGSGIAAVVATGFSTEVGGINLPVAGIEREQTSMRDIDQLGRQLTMASVLGALAAHLYGMVRYGRNAAVDGVSSRSHTTRVSATRAMFGIGPRGAITPVLFIGKTSPAIVPDIVCIPDGPIT
jgi:magnesium-transporting ATPase (P-type)